tara:strand:- start:480 stop:1055 length:576 start_codon:yes stop_codon:yes gene_type:complete
MHEGMKMLEPGVGRGEHLREYKKLGLKVYGTDISIEAQELSPDLDISLIDSDEQRLPFDDNSFDIVYSKSFIEHLRNPLDFIYEAYRVLKPGGMLITLTPDWEVQYRKFYDDYTHVSPFTSISLSEIQEAAGFQNINVSKFRQLPFLWKYPILNIISIVIAPFVPLRTKNKFLRWSWELMLISVSYKKAEN